MALIQFAAYTLVCVTLGRTMLVALYNYYTVCIQYTLYSIVLYCTALYTTAYKPCNVCCVIKSKTKQAPESAEVPGFSAEVVPAACTDEKEESEVEPAD